ncbi:uncharacterized protein LOC116113534 [Pistacia vera]|uniref:uncharacterized protein LOC116113534 n=1 Tax=Pistacia vera TaxID=55513 RepID=UPI00126321FB|nr:uncharacterized protein LOC116113534 [Pistacia vera]
MGFYMDRLNKYSHFLTLKHPYTTRDVASLFVKEIVRLHRFPHLIVSDRDRVFISHFWDAKRREINFEVGDSVYLNLQPYRLRSLAHRYNEKLSPRFYGLFVITEKIGSVVYRLQLPSTTRIHNVFHVSQLKKTTFPPSNVQLLPNALDEDLILAIEPEDVLKKRKLLNGT